MKDVPADIKDKEEKTDDKKTVKKVSVKKEVK